MSDVFAAFPRYVLGSSIESVEDAARRGLLFSEAAQLRDSGFGTHQFCPPTQTAYDLALDLAKLMEEDLKRAGGDARATDVLLYATCFPVNANRGSDQSFHDGGDVKHLLDYPASHLQADMGLDRAIVVGLDQQACTSMLGSIRVAKMFLDTEPDMQQVLCLSADRFPEGAKYEQAYNLISDGAAGMWVGREKRGYKILACHQITNGAMARASDDETVGFYFNYSCRLIQELLSKAGKQIQDVDWYVTQNTSSKAWQIMAGLLRFDFAKVLMPGIGSAGHVISGDNILNMRMLEEKNHFQAGDTVLLTMAGYGLNWQAILLEKV